MNFHASVHFVCQYLLAFRLLLNARMPLLVCFRMWCMRTIHSIHDFCLLLLSAPFNFKNTIALIFLILCMTREHFLVYEYIKQSCVGKICWLVDNIIRHVGFLLILYCITVQFYAVPFVYIFYHHCCSRFQWISAGLFHRRVKCD